MSCSNTAALAGATLIATLLAGPALASPTTGSCSPTKVRLLASDGVGGLAMSTTFVNLPEGKVSFVQGGTGASCVIVSLSANSFATGPNPSTPAPLTVRVMLDDTTPALPNQVDFSDGADMANVARSFDFIFPSVAPGTHSLRVQYKTTADAQFINLMPHNIVVQFAP
jgi:hypothetical protein